MRPRQEPHRQQTDHKGGGSFAAREKVEFFEKLGLPLRLLPHRIYYGMAGNQKRYFALKLPLAVDPPLACSLTPIHAPTPHPNTKTLENFTSRTRSRDFANGLPSAPITAILGRMDSGANSGG